ncbi:MAG: ABC transporter ATP-binding protein [Oscillospiraceae bacterium]|nr:ABC transporter ATP-binding protein [Oscillospiraceae bacterium]
MARNKVDVDERVEVEFNLSHFKRIMKYVKPYGKTLALMTFLLMITGIMNIINPQIIKTTIDSFIPSGSVKGIAAAAASIFIINLITVFITRHRIVTMNRVGQKIIMALRKDVFVHLQKLPFAYYDSRPHGKILVRVVHYVNSLSDLLSNGIVNIITDIFNVFVIILVMFFINPGLALVSMAPFPLFVVIVVLMKTKLHRSWQDYSAKNSNMTAYIQESISGMKVTQAYSREEINCDTFEEMLDECRGKWMYSQKIAQAISPMVDIASIAAVLLMILYGIHNFENGITIGMITQYSMYVLMFWSPVVNLANQYNSITNASAYLERVFELLDEEEIVKNLPGSEEMPHISGKVEFKNVTFGYENNQTVLNNVSFTIEPGETIALVGPTGAGKSTIVNLISRFYNLTSGQILIDGHDISKYTLESLRSQMGVMMQDTFIFSGTIEDNIRYSRLDATEEQIAEAAKTVCADEFIQTMEDKYKTEVNERGSRLSAGQRQLISFARALLADPKILILDEATSSIDTETEMTLQKGLDRLLKGRTSFVIAHRLSTIKNADRIMYVDKGRIVESGNHDELMKKGGAYYRLYTAQYAFMDDNIKLNKNGRERI